jgi:hypothetical protein
MMADNVVRRQRFPTRRAGWISDRSWEFWRGRLSFAKGAADFSTSCQISGIQAEDYRLKAFR